MTINQIQDQIIEEFELFENWIDKYQHIIDFASDLDQINEKDKLDENLIEGCQSKVWLFAQEKDGELFFKADSDAVITKGIIALLLRVFNGQKPEDIKDAKIYFIDKIGLKQHLSLNRANGLLAMLDKIKAYGKKYSK